MGNTQASEVCPKQLHFPIPDLTVTPNRRHGPTVPTPNEMKRTIMDMLGNLKQALPQYALFLDHVFDVFMTFCNAPPNFCYVKVQGYTVIFCATKPITFVKNDEERVDLWMDLDLGSGWMKNLKNEQIQMTPVRPFRSSFAPFIPGERR